MENNFIPLLGRNRARIQIKYMCVYRANCSHCSPCIQQYWSQLVPASKQAGEHTIKTIK